MPSQLCAKCRGYPAQEGDSWCAGCIGWEALGRELTANWDSQGGRHLANDLVVSTCRQVRALRSVTAGLTRSGASAPAAGKSRARGESVAVPEPPAPPRREERERTPRRRPCKEEEVSERECEEESEEEERAEDRSPAKDADHQPLRDGRPRSPPPPPPERGPPGTKSIGLSRQREEHSRERRHRDGSRRGSHHSHRTSNRRGGRKHKRLHRLAENPDLVIHRAPGRSFWELSTDQPGGGLDLSRLGR